MRARRIISSAAYSPDELAILFQAFDEVWDSIGLGYAVHTQEAASVKLAEIILELASSGVRDLEELKTSAIQIMLGGQRGKS